ncbi:MAG: nitrogen fixation protein NifH [Chloroflexota bacterium]
MKTNPALDWLLEKRDPGVRFFALRDLLGAPPDDPEVRAAQRATVRASPVREILAAQKPEGYWVKPGPGYGPKYQGTVWQVVFLGQFGADGDNRRVRLGAEYVLDHSRSPSGGFSANATASGMVHCLEGNLAASLLELGWGEDDRLRQALDWLARSITGEGIASAGDRQASVRFLRSGNSAPGFCCSANNHLACAWGAIPAMDALSRVPAASRTHAIRRAIKVGLEFLLSRDPAVADYPMGWSKTPSRSWFQFGYPMGYVTDALRNAEVLVAIGHGKDRRLKPLADLVLSKRGPDGRWRLEYSYNGKTWFTLEGKRQPSKWVTLRALRALRGMGIEV